MNNLIEEYRLSLYSILTKLNKSKKSEISLVLNTEDNKVYVKKVLSNYSIDVYMSLKKMRHLNMPIIYEIVEINDQLVVIEEFINGETLENILEKSGPISEDKVIRYMISLCNVLNCLHKSEPAIIHRDIKPSNIIINNDGNLKLIDYDVSRQYKLNENRDTTILGTEGYASPEQFGFEQTDCRSDIYSMGVLMNVLTTGEHLKDIKNQGKLKNIIEKCTKISPDDRYLSVMEVRNSLLALQQGNRPQVSTTTEKQPKRRVGLYLWYAFLFTGIIPIVEAESMAEKVEYIALILAMVILTLLFTGVTGIDKKLPLLNNPNDRKWGYIIYTIIIMVIAGLFFRP